MFPNQGYRGLSFLPYPKHIKEIITNINNKAKQIDPDSGTIVYKGNELIPNFDRQLVASKIK